MNSKTPDIFAFSSEFKREVLSQAQLDTLKTGTLQILAEVGVRFPSKKALDIFKDHGADVDRTTQVVRISPNLVEKALSTAPRSFILGGREPRFDLVLDGKHSYLSTDGCGTRVIDLETRQERRSQKEDVARMARICDALPLIGFFWPLVSAQDHGLTAPLHECHAGLTNTLKHVRGGTTVSPELAPYLVEMATVVSGSEKERRKRPPICANICTIAPLTHDHHGIETALVYAEAGIPTSFMAMPTMGSTAPATPWGALVEGDAEVVSAMVLMQLAHPGAPVFHSIEVSLMHPRTGGYVTGVNIPFGTMTVQIAHNWNVPCLGGGGTSNDAKDIGWYSGSASGMGASFIPVSGGEICGYLGMLDGSMLLYPEQIILDHEICLEIYQSYKKVEFDEADMALDVIKSVGPGSHFLREKHTRVHIRDFPLSPIVNEIYLADQRRPSREVALEEFNRINETHFPEPLPKEKLSELNRILAASDKEAERLQA
ncbi:MAG: trimethylamine methyltransferase family protein [Desulfobacteraceae bacterium]|nr:trimethylamine methyltransferase family protein [Desulfobacteraceae bacterium]